MMDASHAHLGTGVVLKVVSRTHKPEWEGVKGLTRPC
jgi:hypothetical protein